MGKLKPLMPHLIAIGIFILIGFMYFSPVLSGKKIEMSDVANVMGMQKETRDFHDKTGIDPLWTGAMFSGMPTFQIVSFGTENFLGRIFGILKSLFPEPVDLLFLNLIGFYILLITLKVDYRLAIAGSIVFAFCTYSLLIIKVGHISKSMAIACMPIVLAGIIQTLKGSFLTGFVLSLIGMFMEVYSNHFQITYYLFIMIGIFLVFQLVESIKEKTYSRYIKGCALLLLASGLALVPNITNLWSTYKYGQFTTRGPSELTSKKVSTGLDFDYATDWSYGIEETLTLLIPNASGGGSNTSIDKSSATYQALLANGIGGAQASAFIKGAPTYWGAQPFTIGPVYIGAITIFLFVLGLFVLKGKWKWWLLVSTILSILLAWGRNFQAFTEFFFFHVPGYNKFRVVSTTLVIATLAIPLLAMLTVKFLSEMKKDQDKIISKLKLAFYITGGVCLLFFLVPGIIGNFEGKSDEKLKQYEWLLTALRQDRESMLRMSALGSLIYISMAFTMLWMFLKKKMKIEYVFYGLIVLSLIDMWSQNKKYLNDDDFISKSKMDHPFTPSNANQQILQDPDPDFRVYNTSVNPFTDAATSYYHKSIGGYHGAKLKRYQELIEYQLGKGNMNVLNMLNTKYFIVSPKEGGETQAQRNPGALGNAWFVDEIKWVANADSEMNSLTDFDPSSTAIIDKRFEKELEGFQFTPDSTATIKLDSYAPNDLVYESSTSSKQFAVLSEIYYSDGWNAYIDGKPVPHVRVNYVLRGTVVPEGKHKIEFKFEPEYYYKAQRVSLAGSVLLSVIILGYFVYSFRKKSETTVK